MDRGSAPSGLALLLLLFGTACAGSEPVATDTQPPAPADTTQTDAPPPAAAVNALEQFADRPPVDRIRPSEGFLAAVEQGTRTMEGRPGERYWQQYTRYTLTARLFPEDKRLEGTARIAYTNQAPGPLPALVLELAQNLHASGAARNETAEVTGGVQIDRVAVNGQVLETNLQEGARYLVDGTLLGVILPSPLGPGATATLEVDWSFTIPQAGASGRMGYSGDDFFFLAYWYPVMSVFDDVEGWFTDPFLGRAEFYGGFADYDLTVEAPAGWIVQGTGALQNAAETLAPEVLQRMRQAYESDEPVQVVGPGDFASATQEGTDGRLRWHFTASQVRDVAFSVTRASIWEAARTPVGDADDDGQVDYAHINTFYRESAPRWSEVTRYQQHAITFLSDFLDFPYPWPHMTAVEGGGIIGGGMEYPMMTLIGDYNNAGADALYAVTAHELAHMWIPMIVSTNERRYSWIDEGTTSFNENQAEVDFHGDDTDYDEEDRNVYLQVAAQGAEGEIIQWSDYQVSSTAFGIASYMKPASLLVTLRGLLGEAVFNRALQDFVNTWAYKHPYPYDFFNTFERVSGQDLDWFWYSFYYKTWTLDQAVASVQPGAAGTEIVVEDLGFAPMPVPLTVTFEGGRTEQHTVPVETWLGGATRTTLTVDGTVTRVEIDPDHVYPDINRANNVWTP